MARAMKAQGKVDPDAVFAEAQYVDLDDWASGTPAWDERDDPGPDERPLPDEPEEIPAEQLPLSVPSDAPKARATDPETSKVAGELGRMRGNSIRAKLLLAFYDERYGEGMTDEEAARASDTYRRADGELTEFATRCSELRTGLLIEFNGHQRGGVAGVDRAVSEITSAGIAYVAERGWRR